MVPSSFLRAEESIPWSPIRWKKGEDPLDPFKIPLSPSLSFETTATMTSESAGIKGLDLSQSALTLIWGRDMAMEARNILADKSQLNRTPIFSVGIVVKLSSVPWLQQGRARARVTESADVVIARTRLSYYAQIEKQVRAAVAANSSIPAFAKPAIQAKTIANFKKEVDARLAQVQQATHQEIDQRIDQIFAETTLQQLSVVIGVSTGSVLFTIQVGKLFVTGGPEPKGQGTMTESELLTMRNSLVSKSLTAHTGAIGISASGQVSESLNYLVEGFVFHDRLPFINGNSYIASLVTQSGSAFDDQRNWWKLNSALLRAVFKNTLGSFYVALGHYKNSGGWAGGAGVSVNFSRQDQLSIDMVRGREGFLSSGVQITYSHEFNSNSTGFISWQKLKRLYSPLSASEKGNFVDGREIDVGAKFTILEKSLGSYQLQVDGSVYMVSLNQEGAKYDGKWGPAAGLNFSLEERVLEKRDHLLKNIE